MPEHDAAVPPPDRDALRGRVARQIQAGAFRFQVIEGLQVDPGLSEAEAGALFDEVAAEERERAERLRRDWVPPMPGPGQRAAEWFRRNWPLAIGFGLVGTLVLFWALGGVRWLAALLLSR